MTLSPPAARLALLAQRHAVHIRTLRRLRREVAGLVVLLEQTTRRLVH